MKKNPTERSDTTEVWSQDQACVDNGGAEACADLFGNEDYAPVQAALLNQWAAYRYNTTLMGSGFILLGQLRKGQCEWQELDKKNSRNIEYFFVLHFSSQSREMIDTLHYDC